MLDGVGFFPRFCQLFYIMDKLKFSALYSWSIRATSRREEHFDFENFVEIVKIVLRKINAGFNIEF